MYTVMTHTHTGRFNKAGNPIKPSTHLRLFKDFKYRLLAFDRLNGVEISTVWLGYSEEPDRPVGIFETMARGDIHQNRSDTIDTTGMDPFSAYLHKWVVYSEADEIAIRDDTEEDAMRSHQQLVDRFS